MKGESGLGRESASRFSPTQRSPDGLHLETPQAKENLQVGSWDRPPVSSKKVPMCQEPARATDLFGKETPLSQQERRAAVTITIGIQRDDVKQAGNCTVTCRPSKRKDQMRAGKAWVRAGVTHVRRRLATVRLRAALGNERAPSASSVGAAVSRGGQAFEPRFFHATAYVLEAQRPENAGRVRRSIVT